MIGKRNDTSPEPSLVSAKCINIFGSPSYGKSFSALPSVIGIVGNVSSNTSILILEGENDSQTTPLWAAVKRDYTKKENKWAKKK